MRAVIASVIHDSNTAYLRAFRLCGGHQRVSQRYRRYEDRHAASNHNVVIPSPSVMSMMMEIVNKMMPANATTLKHKLLYIFKRAVINISCLRKYTDKPSAKADFICFCRACVYSVYANIANLSKITDNFSDFLKNSEKMF